MPTFALKEIAPNDCMTYFAHSIVKVQAPGIDQWVFFSEIHGDQVTVTDGKKAVHLKRQEVKVVATYPTGYHNTKRSAIYLERMPMRQNQKGLTKQNYACTYVEAIVKDYIGKMETTELLMGWKAHSEDSRILWPDPRFWNFLFEESKYSTLGQAYVALKGKKAFSRALSNKFVLVPHTASKDFLIFYHQLPVAELVSKVKIKMLLEEYTQECIDFFVPQGAQVVA